MTRARWAVLAVALTLAFWSIWQLQSVRSGLEITSLTIGTTPATVTRLPGITSAPVVIVAHGFAGSRQLMEGFALTLTRAGYIAVSYDLGGAWP